VPPPGSAGARGGGTERGNASIHGIRNSRAIHGDTMHGDRLSVTTRRLVLWKKRGRVLQSTQRRGWYWGSEHFKEKLLERYGREKIEGSRRGLKATSAVRDHALRDAEKIIREGCSHLGVGEAGMRERRRGDLRKASLAWAMWKQTSAPQAWIAERLALRRGRPRSISARGPGNN